MPEMEFSNLEIVEERRLLGKKRGTKVILTPDVNLRVRSNDLISHWLYCGRRKGQGKRVEEGRSWRWWKW